MICKMKMIRLNNIKSGLMILFNIVFTLMFGYTLCNVISQPSVLWGFHKPIIIMSGALLFLCILIGVNKLIMKCKSPSLKIFISINFLILFILQLFCFRFFMVTPSWDFGVVLNLAEESAISFQGMDEYLYFMYPNNISLYFIFMFIIQFLNRIGVENHLPVLIGINLTIVFLSVFLTFYLVLRRYGIHKGALFSFYMLFITPFYLYTTIVYTDTLAMIFPILAVIIYLNYLESKNSKRYLWGILLGIILGIGVLVKSNVIITLVAILIHFIMTQKGWNIILFCFLLITPFVIINTSFKESVSHYSPIEKDEMGFPPTHWVLMGLQETPNRPGGFNNDTVKLTKQLKFDGLTKKEIAQEHIQMIKEKLEEYGFKNYLSFLGRKINYTWGDGTYYAPKKLGLNPLDKNIFQEYLYGEKCEGFVLFCQIVQVTNLLLIFIGAVSLLKSTNYFEQVLTISLFGTFLFLLLWEARSRYLVLYVPFICSIAMYGLNQLNYFIKRKTNIKI